jgi:hypothetical protein
MNALLHLSLFGAFLLSLHWIQVCRNNRGKHYLNAFGNPEPYDLPQAMYYSILALAILIFSLVAV